MRLGPRAAALGLVLLAAAARAAPPAPDHLEGSRAELEAYLLAQQERYVKARAAAERILAGHPRSFAAHLVLGLAQYYGEGNLPRALWELREARRLFETRYGAVPPAEAPWRWHSETLLALADLLGDMDRPQDKLDVLAAHDRLYQPPLYAERAWPLMKLRRYAEARAMVKRALDSGRPRQRRIALTALCAVESEAGNREPAYQACRHAADEAGKGEGAVEMSNAGAAAMQMLRLDEAERYFLEATRRPLALYGNPWAKLVELYVGEGRIAEAVAAMKEVHAYRRRKPAYADQLSQAETDALVAVLLTALGRSAEALPITRRALERPDRRGGTSSQTEQSEAAAAVLDRLARRETEARLAEEQLVAGFGATVKIAWARARARLAAWTSGRRAAVLLADRWRLLATLRPCFPGGAELPTWIVGEVIGIVGPGVVAEAVREARAQETLPATVPYFEALLAEAALAQGRDREARARAAEALAGLPPAEVLLRARVAAVAAAVARRLGDLPGEIRLADLVLQQDPTAVRRLGLRLPVVLRPDGSAVAARAAALLARSPRFRRQEGGFLLAVGAASACLHAGGGAVLACARVQPRAGEHEDALARRLVDEVHRTVFAPRIDLSQTDIRSLDGSTGVGSARSSEKVKSVLDRLRQPAREPVPDLEIRPGGE